MQTYTPKNLREQFPQLEGLQDLTLSPILDVTFNEWLKQMPDSVVSDIKRLPKHDYFSPHDSYTCVVDGKIVQVNASGTDIDVCDEDEFWYMYNRISFDGDEIASKRLFERFSGFVGEQGLESLVSKSKRELEKGKTYHLSSEMCDFYLQELLHKQHLEVNSLINVINFSGRF